MAAKKAAARKGKAHITVEGKVGREKVTEHASKKEAMAHGKSLRASGKSAFVHSVADAKKYGLDPRTPRATQKGQKVAEVKKRPTAIMGDAGSKRVPIKPSAPVGGGGKVVDARSRFDARRKAAAPAAKPGTSGKPAPAPASSKPGTRAVTPAKPGTRAVTPGGGKDARALLRDARTQHKTATRDAGKMLREAKRVHASAGRDARALIREVSREREARAKERFKAATKAPAPGPSKGPAPEAGSAAGRRVQQALAKPAAAPARSPATSHSNDAAKMRTGHRMAAVQANLAGDRKRADQHRTLAGDNDRPKGPSLRQRLHSATAAVKRGAGAVAHGARRVADSAGALMRGKKGGTYRMSSGGKKIYTKK